MSNNFVKILIKAPNQLIDDQTIHCERNWTVKRLKHHLSSVYPCKPHPDGQKLIYSGQLLSDEAVLSEVLRSYDGQENNTIHLVCSMRDAHKMNRHTPKPIHQPQEFTPLPHENNTWRGNNAEQQASNLRPPGPAFFPNLNNNPQNMIHQSIAFQQAYMNYMAQLSHFYMMASRGATVENSNYAYTPINTNTQANNNRDIPANDRNPRVENEVEEGQDEVRANRDWMEWFYMGSRFFILFTFVYFYSSPERFIMVIAMALILINIDVFRWRRVQQNQNQPPNPVPPVAEESTEVIPPPENNDAIQMNWIYVTWSFMKTFFLSLVPDNRDI